MVSATCKRSTEFMRMVLMAGNIGRFYRGSLGLYFSQDSGLVYDSGTGPKQVVSRYRFAA
jgi:hypothetical protein